MREVGYLGRLMSVAMVTPGTARVQNMTDGFSLHRRYMHAKVVLHHHKTANTNRQKQQKRMF